MELKAQIITERGLSSVRRSTPRENLKKEQVVINKPKEMNI